MKTRMYLSFVVSILVMSSGAVSQQNNKAQNLYQEALIQMEGRGSYNKALEIFGRITKDFQGNRRLCALSHFQIGVCYEKLGKSEAQKAYERVINDFADQREVVAEARSRLGVLRNVTAATPGLTLKKLEYSQLDIPFARLSPDGKKMAHVVYVGGSPKRINILELATGTDRVAVDSGAGGLFSLVWSPGGDKIAYTFRGKELQVRDINGGSSRVLLKNPEYRISPTDWSADGKVILCMFDGDEGTTRISTVTAEGQVKLLASGNSSDFRSVARLSPDGEYVSCSLAEKTGNSDIYVWAADGSRKVRVTENPGRDENPIWSPDGKYLLFLSDRNRSVDLWAIQIEGGVAIGAPFVLKRDLGWRTMLYDLTASGKLCMLVLGGAEPSNLFMIPVDQAHGNLQGAIVPVSLYPTDHFFPRISPNGKLIAYSSRKGQIGLPKLFLLDEKGSERELALQGHYAGNVAWHPENRSVYFAGWDKAYKPGIFEFSLDNEEIKSIYIGDKVDMRTGGGAFININLLPDVNKLMFFKLLGGGDVEVHTYDPAGQKHEIALQRVNMPIWGSPSPTGENICYRTGDSLMLVSVSKGTSKLIGRSTLQLEASWSPDGQSIAFREGSALKIYSLTENTTHTLYQAQAGRTIGGMEMYGMIWSPAGGSIIFTERDTSASSLRSQNLLLVSPRDGSVKALGDAPNGYRLSELRWSPERSKILATANSTSSARTPLYEYWVMENFLPKEKPEARIRKGEKDFKLTKLYGGSWVDCISPDGKQLVMGTSIRDIESGKEVPLGIELSRTKGHLLWSPDCRMVAYLDKLNNLCVVPVAGGLSTTLVKADSAAVKAEDIVTPKSWSSDSRKVIFLVPTKGLFAVPVSGGEWEEILAFRDAANAKEHQDMTLSPDERLVAYVSSQSGNKDVYVMPVKGGQPVRITTNPTEDSGPIWSYDGKWIAFLSKRTESPEIWAVRVSREGKPEGEAFQVSRGGYWGGTWTHDGKIGYCTAHRAEHIFTADPDGSKEVQVTHFPAFNGSPFWFRDGRKIGFKSDYGQRLNTFGLWTSPSKGGEAKPFALREKSATAYCMSPDGKTIAYVTGSELKPGKSLLMLVQAEGGESRELLSFDSDIEDIDWSPDGNNIMLTYSVTPSTYGDGEDYMRERVGGISLVSSESGDVKTVVPAEKKGLEFFSSRWSPDGKRIAFRSFDYQEWAKGGQKEDGLGLWVKDLKTGDSKLIMKGVDGYKHCWPPDGKSVIFEKRVNGMDFDLYKISADGKTPEKLNIKGRSPVFSPDGKKIAYSRRIAGGYEFWLVENFLPADQGPK